MKEPMAAQLNLLGLVIAAPVVLAGCRAKDTKDSTGVYDSPEAVHRAMCDAIQAKDWKKMAGCYTPESLDTVGRDLAVTASMGLFDVPQSAVQELFRKHGLDDAERKGPKAFDDVDKVRFVAEMLALLEKTGNVDAQALAIAGSTLTDLKLQESKATGDLVTIRNGKEYRQRIEFRLIDGTWLVHQICDAADMAGNKGERILLWHGFPTVPPTQPESPTPNTCRKDICGNLTAGRVQRSGKHCTTERTETSIGVSL